MPLLHPGLDTARACGARAVAREAATRWPRTGPHRPTPATVPVRLTSRQQRVSELAAQGLDVNEVAQRLFLTPGTVRAVLASTAAGSGRDRLK